MKSHTSTYNQHNYMLTSTTIHRHKGISYLIGGIKVLNKKTSVIEYHYESEYLHKDGSIAKLEVTTFEKDNARERLVTKTNKILDRKLTFFPELLKLIIQLIKGESPLINSGTNNKLRFIITHTIVIYAGVINKFVSNKDKIVYVFTYSKQQHHGNSFIINPSTYKEKDCTDYFRIESNLSYNYFNDAVIIGIGNKSKFKPVEYPSSLHELF